MTVVEVGDGDPVEGKPWPAREGLAGNGHRELMISSGSKCNESKCSESSRISRSASSSAAALACVVTDGRASASPKDAVDLLDEGDRMLAKSTDLDRGRRAGEKTSSAVS